MAKTAAAASAITIIDNTTIRVGYSCSYCSQYGCDCLVGSWGAIRYVYVLESELQ